MKNGEIRKIMALGEIQVSHYQELGDTACLLAALHHYGFEAAGYKRLLRIKMLSRKDQGISLSMRADVGAIHVSGKMRSIRGASTWTKIKKFYVKSEEQETAFEYLPGKTSATWESDKYPITPCSQSPRYPLFERAVGLWQATLLERCTSNTSAPTIPTRL